MSESFIGTWQRVCKSSHFGSFAMRPDQRLYVVVEPSEGGSLAWRFGSTLEALRVGYVRVLGSRPLLRAVFSARPPAFLPPTPLRARRTALRWP